jgi:inner membrane protein
MATIISHGLVALTLSKLFPDKDLTTGIVITGVLMAMVPDLDVLAFSAGIPYESIWGHRGFTHSILFAIGAAFILTAFLPRSRKSVFLFLFLSIIFHGILDAMTTGGLGVGFFIPFINDRYFFNFRPVLVSPIGVLNFFSSYGLQVIKSEIIFIWIPCVVIYIIKSQFINFQKNGTGS